LTNEAAQLPATAAGVVTSYAPATGTFKVFAGQVDVSASFTLDTPAGGNPRALAVTYAEQSYTVTGGFDAGEDEASLTIRATGSGTYAGLELTKELGLTKAKAGGAAPALVTLTASDRTFQFYTEGTLVPRTIVFTAVKQNGAGGPIEWVVRDKDGTVIFAGDHVAATAHPYLTGISDTQISISHTDFGGWISDAPQRQTMSFEVGYDGTATDRVTINSVRDGASGLTSAIIPGVVGVPCTAAGAPKAALPSVQMSVFEGSGTNVIGSASIALSWDGFTTVANAGGGVFTPSGMTADQAWIEITATVDGVPSTQRASYTKIRDAAPFSAGTDTTIAAPTSTAYAGSNAGPLTIGVGPGGTVSVSASLTYEAPSTGSVQIAGKVRYRTTPGSGGWTDLAAETTGTLSNYLDDPGTINIVQTIGGPVSAQNWEFDLVLRKIAALDPIILGGTFAVNWS
jgi:hypothetical protein